jgi:hypothetical protein
MEYISMARIPLTESWMSWNRRDLKSYVYELYKMPRQFQNQLLNFMEWGRIKVDQQKKLYDFQIKGAKIFGTCNEINRLSKPLQSRFRKLFLPRYTEEQFLDVSEKVLPKLSFSLARYIGANVWKN